VPDGYGGWRWIGATPPIGPRPSGDSRNADLYVLPQPVAKTPQESLDQFTKKLEAQTAAREAARDFAEAIAARDAEWARWGGGPAYYDRYDLYILQRDRRAMSVGFSAMALVPGAQAFAVIPITMSLAEGDFVQAGVGLALLGAGPAWRLARGATPSVGAVASTGIRGGQNTGPLVATLTNPQIQRYLSGSGGRLGGTATRRLNHGLATDLECRGFTVTNGAGRGPEQWIRGPGGGTTGGTWVDITARNGNQWVRIQTVDTLADGVTLTAREAAAAARIRAAFPNDQLILISKQTGPVPLPPTPIPS